MLHALQPPQLEVSTIWPPLRRDCQTLMTFMPARMRPRQMNAPGAWTMMVNGWKPSHMTGFPNQVPLPRISRREPRKVSEMV